MPADNPPVGDWFQTYPTRKHFHVLDFCEGDFDIRDIAHALSHQCRFGGHIRVPFSVGQHSVLVSRLLPPHLQFAGLMHDSSEAFLTDVIRPIKELPGFAAYREREAAIMDAIAEKFAIQDLHDPLVKRADNAMLHAEARDLIGHIPDWRTLPVPPAPDKVRPWSPRKTRRVFLDEFYRLNPQGIRPPRFWAVRKFLL